MIAVLELLGHFSLPQRDVSFTGLGQIEVSLAEPANDRADLL